MDVTENIYPAGIGKHIVCIYDDVRPPPYKQLVGANPEPQYTAV